MAEILNVSLFHKKPCKMWTPNLAPLCNGLKLLKGDGNAKLVKPFNELWGTLSTCSLHPLKRGTELTVCRINKIPQDVHVTL